MAQGSEQFAWKLYPGVKRECWECQRPLKVADVANVRTLYPSNKTQFHCTDCSLKQTIAHVKENRARLEAFRQSS